MSSIRDILFDLLGTPLNIVHTEIETVTNDLTGGAGVYISQVIEYDLEYIGGLILIILFNVGIFMLLLNFQKSWSSWRVRK